MIIEIEFRLVQKGSSGCDKKCHIQKKLKRVSNKKKAPFLNEAKNEEEEDEGVVFPFACWSF